MGCAEGGLPPPQSVLSTSIGIFFALSLGLMSTIGPLVEFDVSVTYKLQQTMLQTHK